MGTCLWLFVVDLVKMSILFRSGQFGLLAICGALHFAQRIAGCVHAGPFLHIVRVHRYSLVSVGLTQMVQQEVFRHRAAGSGVVRNMSILKRGAPETYTSVPVLVLVCDC